MDPIVPDGPVHLRKPKGFLLLVLDSRKLPFWPSDEDPTAHGLPCLLMKNFHSCLFKIIKFDFDNSVT